MTTFLKVKNRAVSTLASGVSDTATSLTVATGDGAKFPSAYPFHITIDDEILECTNRSTDTLTVTRAAEGTAAAAHSAGATVSLNITAEVIQQLQDRVTSGSYTGDDTANRAIAHGLGTTPKLVLLGYIDFCQRIIVAGQIHFYGNNESGKYTVTAWNGTNFYVGNVAEYNRSGNGAGKTYYWVAFA